MVKIEVQSGCSNIQIHRLAGQIASILPEPLQFAEVEVFIVNERKKNLKRILSRYHEISLPSLGIDYSKSSISSSFPIDIPMSLITKIAIDQAIEELQHNNWEYAVVLDLMYFDLEAGIKKIQQFFKISQSQAYYLIDKAVEELLFLLERDIEIWQENLIKQISMHFNGWNTNNVHEIVDSIYSQVFGIKY